MGRGSSRGASALLQARCTGSWDQFRSAPIAAVVSESFFLAQFPHLDVPHQLRAGTGWRIPPATDAMTADVLAWARADQLSREGIVLEFPLPPGQLEAQRKGHGTEGKGFIFKHRWERRGILTWFRDLSSILLLPSCDQPSCVGGGRRKGEAGSG